MSDDYGVFELPKDNDFAFMAVEPPKAKWQMCPTGDWYGIVYSLPSAPNAFHRFMQGLILGMKWRRIENNQ